MELDGLGAEEHRRGDLLVRLPVRDLERDLELLRGELVARLLATPQECSRRSELGVDALDPGGSLEPFEHLERRLQLAPGLDSQALTA